MVLLLLSNGTPSPTTDKPTLNDYEVGGKGKVTDTIWYSPKLKFNIKHIQIKHIQESGGGSRYTNELIDYISPK